MNNNDNPNNRRGAPFGNQNARKHGFYSTKLKARERRILEEAACVDGLDQEIAILRARIKAIVDTEPDNHELLIKAVSALTRMTRAKDQLRNTKSQGMDQVVANILGSAFGPGHTYVREDGIIGYKTDPGTGIESPF